MPPIKTTHLLIAANLLVFAAMLVAGGNAEVRAFSTRTLMGFGADYGPLVRDGQLHRLLTSTFIHLNPLHLLMNMVALYQVGLPLEASLGRRRYVAIYAVAGVLGAAASIAWHWRDPVVSAGASGAITGLIGAAAVVSHRAGTSGIPLRNIMLRWLVMVFVFGAIIHADNAAHLGGLVGGAALAFLLGSPAQSSSPLISGPRIATPRLRVVALDTARRPRSSASGIESVFLLFALVALAFGAAWRYRADSFTPEELINKGVELAQEGHPEEAIAAYRRALQLAPNDATGWYDLGLALGSHGDHDEALKALGRALELDPTGNARSVLVHEHVRYGHRLETEGKLDEAEAAVRLGLAVDENDLVALGSLSHVLYRKRDFPGAIATLRRAIAVDPTPSLKQQLADTLTSAGVAAAQAGRHAEAAPLYREAIELDPADHIAMYNLGLALYSLKDYQSAKTAIDGVIRQHPSRDAYRLLSAIWMELGDTERAGAALGVAASLPEDSQ